MWNADKDKWMNLSIEEIELLQQYKNSLMHLFHPFLLRLNTSFIKDKLEDTVDETISWLFSIPAIMSYKNILIGNMQKRLILAQLKTSFSVAEQQIIFPTSSENMHNPYNFSLWGR